MAKRPKKNSRSGASATLAEARRLFGDGSSSSGGGAERTPNGPRPTKAELEELAAKLVQQRRDRNKLD